MSHVQRAAQFFERGAQFDDAAQDEFHPAVGAVFEAVENVRIEDEQTVNRAAGGKGGVERSVVVRAEIAPEPAQHRGGSRHVMQSFHANCEGAGRHLQ